MELKLAHLVWAHVAANLVLGGLLNLANAGDVGTKFYQVYGNEMDKQTRELFSFGFKCHLVLDFSSPLCPKCCHFEGKIPKLGRLDANCECVDDTAGKHAALTKPGLPSATPPRLSIKAKPWSPSPSSAQAGPMPWPLPPPRRT